MKKINSLIYCVVFLQNIQAMEEKILERSGGSKRTFSSNFENTEESASKRIKLKIVFSGKSLRTPETHKAEPEIQNQPEALKTIRLKIINNNKRDAISIETPKVSPKALEKKDDDVKSLLENLPL